MPLKQRSVVFPARAIDIRITSPDHGDWRFAGSKQLEQALKTAAEVVSKSDEATGIFEIPASDRYCGRTIVEWSAANVRDPWPDTAKYWLKMALRRPLDIVRNLSAKWGG